MTLVFLIFGRVCPEYVNEFPYPCMGIIRFAFVWKGCPFGLTPISSWIRKNELLVFHIVPIYFTFKCFHTSFQECLMRSHQICWYKQGLLFKISQDFQSMFCQGAPLDFHQGPIAIQPFHLRHSSYFATPSPCELFCFFLGLVWVALPTISL